MRLPLPPLSDSKQVRSRLLRPRQELSHPSIGILPRRLSNFKSPPLSSPVVQVYKAATAPVEGYYRNKGLLVDFEIAGGIPETLPRLLSVLQPHVEKMQQQQ